MNEFFGQDLAIVLTAVIVVMSAGWIVVSRRRCGRIRSLLDEQAKNIAVSEQRLDMALEGANLGLWDWNIKTGELFVDHRWLAILGYERGDIEPHVSSWTKILHPEDREAVERKLNEHLAGLHGSYFTEQRLRMKSGEWKWILDTGKVLERGPDGIATRATGVILDIDQNKKYQFHLEKLASTDPLTETYNRRYFFARLTEHFQMLRRGGKEPAEIACSIAILDLDFFKAVNDTYGHQAGDYVLKNFARTLQGALRVYDLLARYGGEEFVIMFLDCNKEKALRVLERIRITNAETVYEFESKIIPVRFSAGLAGFEDFPSFPKSIDDLIRLPDERLYAAKEGGRGRIVAG